MVESTFNSYLVLVRTECADIDRFYAASYRQTSKIHPALV